MTEPELRTALQRCRSRQRLALHALNGFQAALLDKLGPVPLVDASELIAELAAIGDLLAGEEGQP